MVTYIVYLDINVFHITFSGSLLIYKQPYPSRAFSVLNIRFSFARFVASYAKTAVHALCCALGLNCSVPLLFFSYFAPSFLWHSLCGQQVGKKHHTSITAEHARYVRHLWSKQQQLRRGIIFCFRCLSLYWTAPASFASSLQTRARLTSSMTSPPEK